MLVLSLFNFLKMKRILLLVVINCIAVIALANPGISSSISVCPQEPVFSLFDALLGNPDEGGVWTNSDSEVVNENFTPGVTPAGVYTYTVDTPEGPESSTVTITMATCATIPANNDCFNAQFVFPNENIPFTTFGATTDGLPHFGEENCEVNGLSQIENDVWFFYSANCAGIATVTTVGGTNLNTKIAVYNFNCPATTNDMVGCSEDFGAFYQSQVSWPVVNNGVYLIRIGESPGPGSGNGTFSLVQNCDGEFPPVNDNCTDPIVISAGNGIPFNNQFATTDGPNFSDLETCNFEFEAGIDRDIWYSYTPECSGLAIFNGIGGSFLDTRVAIYTESCPINQSSLVACNDDFDGFSQSYIQWAIEEGVTYTIRLGGFPGFAGGSGTFDLTELCDGTVVPNDDCEDAQVITPGEGIAFSTFNATTDGPSHAGDAGCGIFGQNQIDLDVWYLYTASCDGVAEFSTVSGTVLDTRIAVYALYCPNDLTNLVICNDDDASFQSTVNWTVVEGETYLIRLGEFPGQGGGSGTFYLSETCMEVCAMPVINYEVFCTGLNDFDSYFVNAFVATLGNNPPYLLSASEGDVSVPINQTGLIQLGPFENGVPIGFLIESTSNTDCSGSSPTQIGNCLPDNINDDCENIISIPTNTLVSFSNSDAETDGFPIQNAFCGLSEIYNDLWFNFTANCTGDVEITTCPFADFNTAIAVYQSSCDNDPGLFLACSDTDACGEFATSVSLPVIQGIDYYVRVGGLSPEDVGNAVLIINETINLISAGNDTVINICEGSINNLVLNQWISGEVSGGIWTDDDDSGALLGNVLFLTSLPSTGTYNFSYFVEGPCNNASSTLTVNYQICSSLSEVENNNIGFRVFPNPATNKVLIESLKLSGQFSLRLIDLSGRTVRQIDSSLSINEPFEISFGNSLQSGMYFVQITEMLTGSVESHKLIIQ
jgi:hypothetical protein